MHLQYNYCDDGNYSKSLFILSRDMKIFKRLMCFKFTILLISRLLEGVRGWKKPQINLLKQEKRILVFVLHLILCFNVFVHMFKDNFSKQNSLFRENHIFEHQEYFVDIAINIANFCSLLYYHSAQKYNRLFNVTSYHVE